MSLSETKITSRNAKTRESGFLSESLLQTLHITSVTISQRKVRKKRIKNTPVNKYQIQDYQNYVVRSVEYIFQP